MLIIRDSVFSGYDYNRNKSLSIEIKRGNEKTWISIYSNGDTEYSHLHIIKNSGSRFICVIPSSGIDSTGLYGKGNSLEIRLKSCIYATFTKEPIEVYSNTTKIKLPKLGISKETLSAIQSLKSPYGFYNASAGLGSHWYRLMFYKIIRSSDKLVLKRNEAFVSFNKHLITIAGNSQIADWAKLNLANLDMLGYKPWRQQIENSWEYIVDMDKGNDLLLLSSTSRFIEYLLSISYPNKIHITDYDEEFNPMPEDIKALINKDEDLRVKLRDLNERIKAKLQVLIAKHYKR